MNDRKTPDFGDLTLPENIRAASAWILSRLGYESEASDVAFELTLLSHPDGWTINAAVQGTGRLSVYFFSGDELIIGEPAVKPTSKHGSPLTTLSVTVPGMLEKDWFKLSTAEEDLMDGAVVLQAILNALEPK